MLRFLPEKNDDFTQINAFDGEVFIGSCKYTMNGYNMEIMSVDCSDDIITEGLARAAMNCAANSGAYIAAIKKELVCPAFVRLGFEGEDILSVEIPQALTSGGCSCCHK